MGGQMVRRRGGVGVCFVEGRLYAVGGYDAPTSSARVARLGCVERYDPHTDTWALLNHGLRVS